MERWFADNEQTANAAGHYDAMLGLHDYRTGDVGNDVLEPGWTAGANTLANGAGVPLFTANQGSAGRPLTAAAHEFGHVIGAPHADLTCGGNSNGQEGQLWPPDNQGRLQGVKWDWKASAGGKVDPVTDTGAAPLYDLMSYCASEAERRGSRPTTTTARSTSSARYRSKATRRLASARGPMAFASGIAGPGGGRIERVVAPDEADAVPASVGGLAAAAALARRVRQGARRRRRRAARHQRRRRGRDVPWRGRAGRGHGPARPRRDRARHRRRSAAPRIASVTAPRRVRGGWLVRWSASDPDHDALQASVDYSPDGGASWRTVYEGRAAAGSSSRHRCCRARPRARVRVNVSDGFGEARALSPRFAVAGAAPTVQIVRPLGGEAVRAGERILLTGTAFDDAHRELGGRALAGTPDAG